MVVGNGVDGVGSAVALVSFDFVASSAGGGIAQSSFSGRLSTLPTNQRVALASLEMSYSSPYFLRFLQKVGRLIPNIAAALPT